MQQDNQDQLGLPASPPSASTPALALDDHDLPPSYQVIATKPPSFPSASASDADVGSTSSPVHNRDVPSHLAHLFTSPSNAEPLSPLGTDVGRLTKNIEYRQRGKWIETWDPKLRDADVMYRFLVGMALTPPTIKVYCKGAHFVTHDRDETIYDPDDGTPRYKKKGDTEQVIDFDFTIDLSSVIDPSENTAHIHLTSVPPSEPAYRGSHDPTYAESYSPHLSQPDRYRSARREYVTLSSGDSDETDPTDIGRRLTSSEISLTEEYKQWMYKKGVPRWIQMEDCEAFWEQRKGTKSKGKGRSANATENQDQDQGRDIERLSDLAKNQHLALGQVDVGKPELKEWCRAFCADRGLLKEFTMHKFIWGWDFDGLEAAIKCAILSTGYTSNLLSITIKSDTCGVVVRPNNSLSKALGNGFIYFLSWITLIFPLIWIWKHLHSLGGAPWTVSYVSYGMKSYPPLPSTFPSETLSQASNRLPELYKTHPELRHPQNSPMQLQYGPSGVHYLLGRKEGEWFREWEERIRMGVRMRYKGELEGEQGERSEVALGLDGY